MVSLARWQRDIDGVALAVGVDPVLLAAIVRVESGGEPEAINPEPRYQWFWDVRLNRPFRRLNAAEVASKVPPADFPTLAGDRDQEWWLQQASLGLCQVMGAVARENGFRGRWLTALIHEPVLSLEHGAKALRRCLRWAEGDVPAALAAYNGGFTADNRPGVQPKRNQAYVSKVLSARA